MTNAVSGLLELLDVERLEVDLFRGFTPDEEVDRERVYGGQVIAQALASAYRTVADDRLCHSLHAYFIRPGDPKIPIVYEVDRSRDGGSFTTRRVVAIQHGLRCRRTAQVGVRLTQSEVDSQHTRLQSGASQHTRLQSGASP